MRLLILPIIAIGLTVSDSAIADTTSLDGGAVGVAEILPALISPTPVVAHCRSI